jgi:ribosomal protein S21
MANAVRVRVELKQNGGSSHEDREIAFRKMFAVFKKMVTDSGIMHSYKEHETYESKSIRKRRKKREAEIARLKAKLRENLLLQGRTNE